MRRRVVGIPELTYVGEHGLELAPEAAVWAARIRAFADAETRPVERKPLTVSFHYREAADEAEARRELSEVASPCPCRRAGTTIRPDGARDPASRCRRQGNGGSRSPPPTRRSTGPSTPGTMPTDLDAFGALDGLKLGIRIAVTSTEAPRELSRAADLTVGSPDELLELLRRL